MSDSTPPRSPDPRPDQTRWAIIDSFNQKLLSEPYERIQVDRVAGDAGVGRSTFYDHFRNKDEVLRHAAAHPLGKLADAVLEEPGLEALRWVLEHFWENRAMARRMLSGDTAATLHDTLGALIRERLERRGAGATRIPPALAAAQIAGAQLGLVRAWVDGEARCDASSLAAAVRASSLALVDALQVD